MTIEGFSGDAIDFAPVTWQTTLHMDLTSVLWLRLQSRHTQRQASHDLMKQQLQIPLITVKSVRALTIHKWQNKQKF